MAIDHYAALKYVIGLAASKTELSDVIIRKIASLIMDKTGSEISSMAGNFDSSKGDYRKVTARAGNTTFMDYQKVPEKVNELLNYINDTINTVKGFQQINELAFDAHFQMVSIHPFADGNGRLSRLLMNYVQHYHKIPLTAIYLENKSDYFTALEDTRNQKDITIFRKFMFDQTTKNLLEKIEELSQKQVSKKGKGMNFLF